MAVNYILYKNSETSSITYCDQHIIMIYCFIHSYWRSGFWIDIFHFCRHNNDMLLARTVVTTLTRSFSYYYTISLYIRRFGSFDYIYSVITWSHKRLTGCENRVSVSCHRNEYITQVHLDYTYIYITVCSRDEKIRARQVVCGC